MFHHIQTPISSHLQELRNLVKNLGRNGGQISPSVYDTAQLLRLYPPCQGSNAGLDWVAAQQQADGAWGNPETPIARHVPTLAAVLALHTLRRDRASQERVKAGLAFLRSQADQWADVHYDLLPIAVEMILPCLIDEASRVGLHLDRSPYRWLFQVKAKKQQLLTKIQIAPATAPMHSWEALGNHAPLKLLDRPNSIGHSPAATAQWLKSTQGHPELAAERAAAEKYLLNAAAATGVDIPGVVPYVWPITGFEITYAPFALLHADLLHHPALADLLKPLLAWHDANQTELGMSSGFHFAPDVDVTALSAVFRQAIGQPFGVETILRFQNGDHFCTYPHELNPSVFSNAHAVYALTKAGHRTPAAEQYLKERQLANGRWMSDKWHTSWIYTTAEVIYALAQCDAVAEIHKAGVALLNAQKPDGSWGSSSHSTRAETSVALMALRTLQKGACGLQLDAPIVRGTQWLCAHADIAHQPEQLWLGKELYSPYRVDRVYELSALLAFESEREEVIA